MRWWSTWHNVNKVHSKYWWLLLLIKYLTCSKKQTAFSVLSHCPCCGSGKPLGIGLLRTSFWTTPVPQLLWTQVPSVAGMHRIFHLLTSAHSGLSLWNTLSPVLCLANSYLYLMSLLRCHFSGKLSPFLMSLISVLPPHASWIAVLPYHSSSKETFYLPQ